MWLADMPEDPEQEFSEPDDIGHPEGDDIAELIELHEVLEWERTVASNIEGSDGK